ncbi:MAG: hypothetical protein KDK41_08230 [Leptospiraceae bacterium]|nr:hypothetical protein [Leptospiraceae bacterium]
MIWGKPIDIHADKTRLQLGSTFSWNQGNVDRLLWRNDLEFSHLYDFWGLSTSTSHMWGTFSGFQTENDLNSRNFGYLVPQNIVYPFVMYWAETGLRRKIDARHQGGLGGTFSPLSEKTMVFQISLMVSVERNFYNGVPYYNDGNLRGNYGEIMRLTPRVFFRYGEQNKIQLTLELWYQMAVDSERDFRWHFEGGLEIPLSVSIHLRLIGIYHFESTVPLRVLRNDSMILAGASYKFFQKGDEQ